MKRLISGLAIFIISFFALAGSVSAKVNRVPGPWYLKGNYNLVFTLNGTDYNHTLVIDSTNTETGDFTGHGWYNADTSYTWNVTGGITNSTINYTITYTGTNAGYTLTATGTVASNGTLSGTATSNQNQSFTWKASSGKALRFTGNHGQWIRFATNKRLAARSRFGMPMKSHGHVAKDISENDQH